ncbi:hypothetical protein [Microbispora catharanthi]|uniref:Uncharacterized protein n=1 Tax=Microbispora catharanthi TaxID=1712871 RepID=A0A5N6C5N9_9ACTN|nr:hypothetical protein [Microbispora catharanthi]KAB8188072.1 hypothetical protein FH610_002855 [Microbispora catharanthi]
MSKAVRRPCHAVRRFRLQGIDALAEALVLAPELAEHALGADGDVGQGHAVHADDAAVRAEDLDGVGEEPYRLAALGCDGLP